MQIKYYGDKVEKGKKAISLCGNNKIKSCRKDSLEILKKLKYDGIVYIPELKDGIQVFKK